MPALPLRNAVMHSPPTLCRLKALLVCTSLGGAYQQMRCWHDRCHSTHAAGPRLEIGTDAALPDQPSDKLCWTATCEAKPHVNGKLHHDASSLPNPTGAMQGAPDVVGVDTSTDELAGAEVRPAHVRSFDRRSPAVTEVTDRGPLCSRWLHRSFTPCGPLWECHSTSRA